MRNLSCKKLICFSTIVALIIIFCIAVIVHQYNRTRINIDKFSQYVMSSPVYCSNMKELDITNIQKHYNGLDTSDILKGKVFVSTDGTAREFAVIEAKGTENTNNVQKAFDRYCCDLLQKYQLENNEEYERLKGYFILRTRDYSILTISDSMGSGYKIIGSYFDKTDYDKMN